MTAQWCCVRQVLRACDSLELGDAFFLFLLRKRRCGTRDPPLQQQYTTVKITVLQLTHPSRLHPWPQRSVHAQRRTPVHR
jgi:hypothetical protein